MRHVRLEQQGRGLARALDELDVRLHERAHRRAPVSRAYRVEHGGRQSAGDRSQQARPARVDDREVQLELRREMAIEDRLGDLGVARDVVHRDVVIPAIGEQLLSDGQHLCAPRVARHPRALRAPRFGLRHPPTLADAPRSLPTCPNPRDRRVVPGHGPGSRTCARDGQGVRRATRRRARPSCSRPAR